MTEDKDRGLTIYSDARGRKAFDDAVKEMNVVDPETVEITEDEDYDMNEVLGNMPTNIPYKRIYNSEGELANPIVKGRPYLNPFMNRRSKRQLIRKATKNPKNNKRGARIIITPFAKGKFIKTHVIQQRIGNKVIFHNKAILNK